MTKPQKLDDDEIAAALARLDGWQREGDAIAKTYRFPDYHEMLAFVNATAWISHREDHHPDIALGYNTCKVTYSTHSVGGLSLNDFVCAAEVDGLFSL